MSWSLVLVLVLCMTLCQTGDCKQCGSFSKLLQAACKTYRRQLEPDRGKALGLNYGEVPDNVDRIRIYKQVNGVPFEQKLDQLRRLMQIKHKGQDYFSEGPVGAAIFDEESQRQERSTHNKDTGEFWVALQQKRVHNNTRAGNAAGGESRKMRDLWGPIPLRQVPDLWDPNYVRRGAQESEGDNVRMEEVRREEVGREEVRRAQLADLCCACESCCDDYMYNIAQLVSC